MAKGGEREREREREKDRQLFVHVTRFDLRSICKILEIPGRIFGSVERDRHRDREKEREKERERINTQQNGRCAW